MMIMHDDGLRNNFYDLYAFFLFLAISSHNGLLNRIRDEKLGLQSYSQLRRSSLSPFMTNILCLHIIYVISHYIYVYMYVFT